MDTHQRVNSVIATHGRPRNTRAEEMTAELRNRLARRGCSDPERCEYLCCTGLLFIAVTDKERIPVVQRRPVVCLEKRNK